MPDGQWRLSVPHAAIYEAEWPFVPHKTYASVGDGYVTVRGLTYKPGSTEILLDHSMTLEIGRDQEFEVVQWTECSVRVVLSIWGYDQ